MHDIDTKNNKMAHLWVMGYQCTPKLHVSYGIVLEISCLQAFLDKITLSSAHYAY